MRKIRNSVNLQKSNWLLLLSSLLLYFLSIFASVGVGLLILIIINGGLPKHISLFEFAMLGIAVLTIVPVYFWHKSLRKRTK